MKKRDLQRIMRYETAREKRPSKSGEKMIEYRDLCGLPNPTPYEAVKICIMKEKLALAAQLA